LKSGNGVDEIVVFIIEKSGLENRLASYHKEKSNEH
jgi:hypothetical protein